MTSIYIFLATAIAGSTGGLIVFYQMKSLIRVQIGKAFNEGVKMGYEKGYSHGQYDLHSSEMHPSKNERS
jgi:hypothetical protein